MGNFTEDDSMVGVYMIMAILISAAPCIYFLYRMLQDINDSNFDHILRVSSGAKNAKKKYTTENATCRICNVSHTDANPLSLGGCAVITCEKCFVLYKFLPNRCGLCNAYLCYRKYRFPLLQNTERLLEKKKNK